MTETAAIAAKTSDGPASSDSAAHRDRNAGEQHERNHAQFRCVLARDRKTHFAREVVFFGVRRLERAHFAEGAESRRGFGRRFTDVMVDEMPVRELDAAPSAHNAITSHAANVVASSAAATSHNQHAALATASDRYAGNTHALLHARMVFSDV